MPFDQPTQSLSGQAAISDLARKADEALEGCDRARCVDLIQQIYALLDSSSASYVVGPVRSQGRTGRRTRRD